MVWDKLTHVLYRYVQRFKDNLPDPSDPTSLAALPYSSYPLETSTLSPTYFKRNKQDIYLS
eukprot:1006629-Ditylum_brightwellii.AAC.1